MRDRLIELIDNAGIQINGNVTPYRDYGIENLADYILADGWIKLPCKVGDKVHKIIPKCTAPSSLCPYRGGYGTARCGKGDENCNAYIEVIPFTLSLLDRMNVDVFLTKEEAEAKLKEGTSDDL